MKLSYIFLNGFLFKGFRIGIDSILAHTPAINMTLILHSIDAGTARKGGGGQNKILKRSKYRVSHMFARLLPGSKRSKKKPRCRTPTFGKKKTTTFCFLFQFSPKAFDIYVFGPIQGLSKASCKVYQHSIIQERIFGNYLSTKFAV